MQSTEYDLADTSLWPNVFSFQENQRIQSSFIQNTIRTTKESFFSRNSTQFTLANIQQYLDPSRDVYYPPKTSEPCYCRAGLHYSVPDQAVGIGLKIKPDQDNQNQWAILYHGTKPNHLKNILFQGLKPGAGQAHQGKSDPYGVNIPRGVYFSFWLNQAFTYTLPDNPIVLECFVKDVYVAPGQKGYTVSNAHRLSRILIPLKKIRTCQEV